MAKEHADGEPTAGSTWARLAHRFNSRRDALFERFVQAYGRLLGQLLGHPGFTLRVAGAVTAISLLLTTVIGTDFFPTIDAGLMKLHFRAPPGTRLERSEQLVTQVEAQIRQIIPAAELQTINAMIGVPPYHNLAFVPTDNVSAMDTDILIALSEGHHPTEDYMRALRQQLPPRFPGSTFYFQPADIVSQVLNFGLSAPLDIQVEYPNLTRSFAMAQALRDRVREVPGVADVHIMQIPDYPTLKLDVDRQQAAQLGLSQRDVATSLLISLSSSGLIAPSYFLNPANNVNYLVVVKEPLQKLQSVSDLLAVPLTPPAAATLWQLADAAGSTPMALPQALVQTISSVATLSSQVTPDQINHHTVQRVLDIQANLDGRDLGAVARDIEHKIAGLGPLPAGMRITLRGQNEVMQQSFRSLGLGLLLAIVLVYFLMVVLFQSCLDPFIIMIAVPGALVGILWMLAVTHTTINVESLMGAIMAVGIAVSNSILLVSFANESRVEAELSATQAALLAGKTRLRPVLMTALAMILGMIPMALALGEAGEQNAPLGRAVIGGLLMATLVTLLVVPVVYSLLRQALPDGTATAEKVTRLAGSLDARTRMMLIEVDVDNHDRRIVPGSFVTVSLTLKQVAAQEIPVEALVVHGKQTLVAAVTADQHIHFVPLSVLSNNGAWVRIHSNLHLGDTVALNLGDRVPEGSRVQPASTGAAAPRGPK